MAAITITRSFRYDLNQIPYDYTVKVTNIFKGLDLIDKVPETRDGGLWHCTGDRDQDHPPKKKCKKAKWLSEEALQIVEKRRDAKGKEETERNTHLNAEFQRIARRDKKAFLSDQCKEVEENNRMGKTRDLFKKMRYQGNMLCKDGHNRGQKWYWPNRSRRFSKEVARIHKTIQKKIFMTQITTMVSSLT